MSGNYTQDASLPPSLSAVLDFTAITGEERGHRLRRYQSAAKETSFRRANGKPSVSPTKALNETVTDWLQLRSISDAGMHGLCPGVPVLVLLVVPSLDFFVLKADDDTGRAGSCRRLSAARQEPGRSSQVMSGLCLKFIALTRIVLSLVDQILLEARPYCVSSRNRFSVFAPVVFVVAIWLRAAVHPGSLPALHYL
eukprot:SAG22_NODE_1666_length_3859_cov_292.311702_4_plen_196_part_00